VAIILLFIRFRFLCFSFLKLSCKLGHGKLRIKLKLWIIEQIMKVNLLGYYFFVLLFCFGIILINFFYYFLLFFSFLSFFHFSVFFFHSSISFLYTPSLSFLCTPSLSFLYTPSLSFLYTPSLSFLYTPLFPSCTLVFFIFSHIARFVSLHPHYSFLYTFFCFLTPIFHSLYLLFHFFMFDFLLRTY
jgi:hypothetical protein